LQLIPRRLLPSPDPTAPTKAFSRQRKLPLPTLFVFLLSLTASGKHAGVDGKSGAFFRHARRSGLWPEAEAVHRSAVTKARAKLPWAAFAQLHQEAVRLAYDLWPAAEEDTWQGLSVFAIDGSQYRLPASPALREAFDPDSGLDHPGKGHYPECLVSTVYDVFRRLPITRSIRPMAQANEREALKALLPQIPSGGVLLLDRGYPSYDLMDFLNRHYQGAWLFRCPARSTFPAVEAFVRSDQTETMLTLESAATPRLRVRAIRLVSPDGTVSVLLTNLMEAAGFSADAIIALYFRRWAVETHYRDEKTSMGIETFHSQTENGIRQELFAILIMAVITRLLMRLTTDPEQASRAEPQFKHALISLAQEAAVLTPLDPERALVIFCELLEEMARVLNYRPKIPRPSQPRVCKKPINKWQVDRAKRMAEA
jgi:hypothetical protein